MEEKKEKEESLTKQLYHFAGSYKYLSILSTILAAISAFVALVPFYYIWKVMQEVLRVRFDFSKAAGISTYGWRAVGFAILGMIIYMAGLMCSYRSIPCTGTDENSNDEPHHDITIRIY